MAQPERRNQRHSSEENYLCWEAMYEILYGKLMKKREKIAFGATITVSVRDCHFKVFERLEVASRL